MQERNVLGGFEELVLLAIAEIGEESYGVPIRQAVERATGKTVSVGALYTTLERLEQKGLVSSRVGEATAERGGRAKKHYRIEAAGEESLRDMEQARKAIKLRWARPSPA